MATKIEIINSIPPTQVNISRKEFIRLINLVTPDSEDIPYIEVNKPKYLKKGDVYIAAVGSKKRPVVIASFNTLINIFSVINITSRKTYY